MQEVFQRGLWDLILAGHINQLKQPPCSPCRRTCGAAAFLDQQAPLSLSNACQDGFRVIYSVDELHYYTGHSTGEARLFGHTRLFELRISSMDGIMISNVPNVMHSWQPWWCELHRVHRRRCNAFDVSVNSTSERPRLVDLSPPRRPK